MQNYNHRIEWGCVNFAEETRECLLGENAKCSQRADKECECYEFYNIQVYVLKAKKYKRQ